MRTSHHRPRPTSSVAPASPTHYPLPPQSPTRYPLLSPQSPTRYLLPLQTPTSRPLGSPDSPSKIARPPLLLPTRTKRLRRSIRVLRSIRSIFRAFPVFSPSCTLPASISANCKPHDGHIQGGVRMTGTLFGHRKGRISLSIQESSRCLPILLLELAISTTKLLQDMGSGLVRIALECEKQATTKIRLLDEPIWTLYCNGKKVGYGTKREPSGQDLRVMQTLHAVSMGAGVIPGEMEESPDGELTYMRANFERVVGSKDSETYYMMNPDGNSGPELSIFLVRI